MCLTSSDESISLLISISFGRVRNLRFYIWDIHNFARMRTDASVR